MYKSWYCSHYHEMSDAGKWFHGSGINLLPPDTWEDRPYRVLIVRLSTMRDTAESFTHRLLYQIAVGCDGVFADCAWLPPPNDGALFDRDGVPWMTGAVTKRPAMDFDCIAISNSIVQELINIPVMMRKSAIPIEKSQRMIRQDVPLVILGGANALFTSALLCDDPAVDLIFIGDDAGMIAGIFSLGLQAKKQGETKQALLRRLVEIPGMIEPDGAMPKDKLKFTPGKTLQMLNGPLFTGEGNTGTGWLRISDGCPCLCTFCAEGWSRKPYRETGSAECVEAALAMKRAMGLERINIYSFNFNMHSEIKELLWDLSALFQVIGLKSQRLDGIADDPELIKIMHAVGKSSITVGIEGISQPLRAWLQKGLAENKIRRGLTLLLQAPVRELKLFFLATGRERSDDIAEFRELLDFIAGTMLNVNRFPRVIVSMTPMVRFPFTPLENEPGVDPAVVRETILQCERIARSKRFEFRSAASMNDYVFSQAFVRANGRRVWKALCETVAEMEFVYYRDISDRFMEAVTARLHAAGIDIWRLIQDREEFGRMPVKPAVSDDFLEAVRQAGEAFADMGNCLGSNRMAGTCLGCGACEKEHQSVSLTAPRAHASIKAELLSVRIRENNRCVEVHIECSIGAGMRGVERSLIAAMLARVFMAYDPLLVRLYRGFGGSLIEKRFETDWIHGDDILTLRFQEAALELLAKAIGNREFSIAINRALGADVRAGELSMQPGADRKVAISIAAPWKSDPSQYLDAKRLKYTAIRSGDVRMRYQLTKDALKKQVIESIDMSLEAGEYCISIIPAAKFRYEEFVRSAVALPSGKHWVRVIAAARFLPFGKD